MVDVKEKYGFVYIWRDRKHKRYYIGSHWGHEDDGYICSSNWMRDSYRRRPEDFKRRILSRIYTSRQDLLNKELEWFSLIKPEEIKIRYYNLNITYTHNWVATDNALSIREKISVALKGRKLSKEHRSKMSAANKGKTTGPLSEEHKSKISESKKGKKHTEESKDKMSVSSKGQIPWNKGMIMSEEHRTKLSAAKKGKSRGPMSEETKTKISNSCKGRVPGRKSKSLNKV